MRTANWPLRILVAVLATAGTIAACHDNIPGPTIPLAPEVGPQAPRPRRVEPNSLRVERDAGVPMPTPLEVNQPRGRRASVRVAETPVDAGVSDVIDLPPVLDADLPIYEDAAQPLN
jgi:hypothetical protein